MQRKKEEAEKVFAEYISQQKVLIADSSSASRAGLAKTLTDLGAVGLNIVTAASYSDAEEEIKKHKPGVILCDYDLGGKCGLNLLQRLRETDVDMKKSLFVLVTGNSSQSAVAQAAEEDVDTFILKPYTIGVFRQNLVKSALDKLYPTDYMKKIEEGKSKLENEQYDEAFKSFEEAVSLETQPTLALFYNGYTHYVKDGFDEAEGNYEKGLSFNKIHYKCLTGLFELFMKKKKFERAYDVVKRISRYFPANPKRLATVLKLAIMTKNYDDIEKYYQVFTTLEERNEEIIRYVCAALVVVGKHYLQQNHRTRGLTLLKNAGVSSGGKPRVMREVIRVLVDQKLAKEAGEALERIPKQEENMTDYSAMSLLVQELADNPSVVIETGRKYLKEGIQDPVIYEVLIRTSFANSMDDYAENLTFEAVKKFPEQKAMFEGLKKKAEESAQSLDMTPEE